MNRDKWISLLMAVALLMGSAGSVTAQDQTLPIVSTANRAQPAAPASKPIIGSVVQSAMTLPDMDAAPSKAEATVIDKRNPNWVTQYGTEAGRKFLPPRQPVFEAMPQGPAVPLGAWQSLDLGGTMTINGIANAYDGRLFVAVYQDGLRVYAPGSDGAYSWSAIHSSFGGLASNNVTSLAVLGNELWVSTSDSGVSLMNLSTGTWRTFSTFNSGIASNIVNRLTVTDPYAGEFELWVNTNNGASIYRNDGFTESWSTLFSGKLVYDVAIQVVNGFGTYWVTTSDGVYRQNGATWTPFNSNNTGVCSMDRATRMIVDNHNTLWFSSQHFSPAKPNDSRLAPTYYADNGVCSYSTTGTWAIYNSTVPGLPFGSPSDMSVDGAGRVWMGFRGVTPYGGVAVYDQGTWLIMQQAGGYPLTTNDVSSIQAIGETVWIGHSSATGLDGYSPNWQRNDLSSLFNQHPVSALLVDQTTTWVGIGNELWWRDASAWHSQTVPATNAITAFTRDVSGTLWIGTAGSGLFTFDGSTFTFQSAANGLPSNDIRALITDHAGRLWVATSAGLALRGNSYWLALTKANSQLTSNDLRTLTVDATDRLWIGTADQGINIFDPNAKGVSPWSTQTIANGLPSNTINGLATDPSGAIWAATTSGVGERDALTTTWKIHNTTSGELPSNVALSVASDPAGCIWVGTGKGLALREAGGWQWFTLAGSALGSDRVVAVASDGNLMWAASGTVVATRGILTGPIGFFPPTVSSFAPTQGAPLSTITIAGDNFDERGPWFNTVKFSNFNQVQSIPGQVLAANRTSLTIMVPALANTGKILVTAHNLNGQSGGVFTIVPAITGFNAPCIGLGSELDIFGNGFTGAGSDSAYVKIGNGPWRYVDARDASEIRQFIRPGDTPGPVSVRLGTSGVEVVSSQSVSIATPQVDSVALQQAVQSLQMIWGKRTLVQLALKSSGAVCNSHVDTGYLEWKKKDGTTLRDYGAFVPLPSGLVVEPTAPLVSLATTANFVAGKDFTQVPFALSDFDGMRIHLSNGPVELFVYDIPASAFGYLDTGSRFQILNVQVYPTNQDSNARYAQFMQDANTGLDAAARIFPQQDMEARFGPNGWLEWAARTVGRSSPVNLNDDNTFDDLQDEVDDIRTDINDNGGHFNQAVAVIDQNLYTGGPRGKATTKCGFLSDCDQETTVSFNLPGQFLAPYLQEVIHASHWVDEGSPNYASYNSMHSRYDEAQRTDVCTLSQTYRQALLDQVGYVARVVRLDWAAQPVEFSLAGCDPTKQPRSIMSYAPSDNNNNAFLEPIDYNHELAYIRLAALLGGAANAMPAAPNSYTQTLRFAGDVDSSDRVTVTMSYLLGVGDITSPTLGGVYHLDLRAADNTLLLDQPFNVGNGDSLSEMVARSRFNLRVPFPDGTTKVELRLHDSLIWSRSVPVHSPIVNLSSPNGGTYNATDSVPVVWTASHPDGVPLQFLLDYSPDNGTTWIALATNLTGTSYNWQPGFVPPSTQGRLRLRASDGFHVTTAVSTPFTLTARAPIAVTRSPKENQSFTEGQTIDLSGGSMTADGMDAGTFQWAYDGVALNSGQNISYTLNDVGTHVFSLQVTSHGLTGTHAVTVTVLADYSHSGIPDAWQLQYKLNPLDPTQAFADPIGKGLTNLQDFQLGLNPLVMDSDGNGGSDAAEIATGLDPLQPNQQLPTGPMLSVGANSVGFSMRYGDPAPAPWTIWVTNRGIGNVAYTVSGGAPWLGVSPQQGNAPTPLTIVVTPTGLLTGTYISEITVSASGAAGSPHVIKVTLNVGTDAAYRVYLPMVRKF